MVSLLPTTVAAADQASSPKLRILVDKTMTIWLKMPMEDAVRQASDAGFNVFSPALGGRGAENPRQMRQIANLARQHGISTVVWMGGTRRVTENEPRFTLADGRTTDNLSPNADELWDYWEQNLLRAAEVSRDTVLMGAFLDFETYPFVVWAYPLSYDEKILADFAAARNITIPSLEPRDRHPWLVQQGLHDAFEKFQLASWRQRAKALREKIDRIDPDFQFFIYPGMKSLFITEALLPEWSTPRAPVTFGMFDTYGRTRDAIVPGNRPVPDHATSLRINQQLIQEELRSVRTQSRSARVLGGIDPVVRGADPEFCAANAVMASETADGYWVFYEVQFPGSRVDRRPIEMRTRAMKHHNYFHWFTKANEAIASGDGAFWKRPRITQDLYQSPFTEHPVDQDKFHPIALGTDAKQIGIYQLDDAIMQRFKPLIDSEAVTLHPIHATWPSYLKPLDMLLLQDFTYDDFTSGIARGHLRQFVQEGGKLILIGDSVGLFARPDFFEAIAVPQLQPPGHDEWDRVAMRTIQIPRQSRQRLNLTPTSTHWNVQGRRYWIFELGPEGQALLRGDDNHPVSVVGPLGEGEVALWGGQPVDEEIDVLMALVGQMLDIAVSHADREAIVQQRLNAQADQLERRAQLAEQQEKYADALRLYAQYVERFSEAKRYEQVKVHYEQLKADPKVASDAASQSAEAQGRQVLAIARAYFDAGLDKEARDMLQQLIRDHPGTTWSAQAKAMLEE